MRVGLVKQEMLHEINGQEAPHAVIRKTLPHLGKKQDPQAFGVMVHFLGDWENRGQGDKQAAGKHNIPNNTPKISHLNSPQGPERGVAHACRILSGRT